MTRLSWLAALSSVSALLGCGNRFDDFRETPIVGDQQLAFVSTAGLDDAGNPIEVPGKLLLLNLDGSQTPCEGRQADDVFPTACVLYDQTEVLQAGNFQGDGTQLSFVALSGFDEEVFVTNPDAPFVNCISGDIPIQGSCNVSQNPLGADRDPVFGIDLDGLNAVFFQSTQPRDTNADGVLDTVLSDLASSAGASVRDLTFFARGADLASVPSAPSPDFIARRLYVHLETVDLEGIFSRNVDGSGFEVCEDDGTPILGSCLLFDSPRFDLAAVAVADRLYILREAEDGSRDLVFVQNNGLAPDVCPEFTELLDGACSVVNAGTILGVPGFSNDGLFFVTEEQANADVKNPTSSLRLFTRDGQTPAACLPPFALVGEENCSLQPPIGFLKNPSFRKL